jgi:hypothetical protein
MTEKKASKTILKTKSPALDQAGLFILQHQTAARFISTT